MSSMHPSIRRILTKSNLNLSTEELRFLSTTVPSSTVTTTAREDVNYHHYGDTSRVTGGLTVEKRKAAVSMDNQGFSAASIVRFLLSTENNTTPKKVTSLSPKRKDEEDDEDEKRFARTMKPSDAGEEDEQVNVPDNTSDDTRKDNKEHRHSKVQHGYAKESPNRCGRCQQPTHRVNTTGRGVSPASWSALRHRASTPTTRTARSTPTPNATVSSTSTPKRTRTPTRATTPPAAAKRAYNEHVSRIQQQPQHAGLNPDNNTARGTTPRSTSTPRRGTNPAGSTERERGKEELDQSADSNINNKSSSDHHASSFYKRAATEQKLQRGNSYQRLSSSRHLLQARVHYDAAAHAARTTHTPQRCSTPNSSGVRRTMTPQPSSTQDHQQNNQLHGRMQNGSPGGGRGAAAVTGRARETGMTSSYGKGSRSYPESNQHEQQKEVPSYLAETTVSRLQRLHTTGSHLSRCTTATGVPTQQQKQYRQRTARLLSSSSPLTLAEKRSVVASTTPRRTGSRAVDGNSVAAVAAAAAAAVRVEKKAIGKSYRALSNSQLQQQQQSSSLASSSHNHEQQKQQQLQHQNVYVAPPPPKTMRMMRGAGCGSSPRSVHPPTTANKYRMGANASIATPTREISDSRNREDTREGDDDAAGYTQHTRNSHIRHDVADQRQGQKDHTRTSPLRERGGGGGQSPARRRGWRDLDAAGSSDGGGDVNTSLSSTSSSPQQRRTVSPKRATEWIASFMRKLDQLNIEIHTWQSMTKPEQEEFFSFWRMPQLQRILVSDKFGWVPVASASASVKGASSSPRLS